MYLYSLSFYLVYRFTQDLQYKPKLFSSEIP